jgi:hypothetical protein
MAMNKQRRTSNINNIVVYDDGGNVTLPAGLTITGLNSAGFVKTNASGVFSIDTAAYITLASAITGYSVGANTALAAADTLLAALGKIQGQLNARSGTVTSVALSLPAIFSVSGSPVTTSGTLSATLVSQTANQFFAAPNGAAGAPVFRAIVAADIPALNYQAPLNGTGFIKATGATISYDNSTYYLASNPSGYTNNTGTVTSVAALTLGTTGTDLSSSVANGSTTAVITLNVPTASAANRGALSAADWSTFNGKQTALNGTGFVKISGTTISYDNSTYLTGNQSINVTGDASGSGATTINLTLATVNSNTGTFNNVTVNTKGLVTAASNVSYLTGNQTISLTGEAGGSGATSISVTLSNSAVISKVLTGLNITGGTVAATDSILVGFGKLQNQVNGLTGGVTYQGTWNASTNIPALASSAGTKGFYYVVSVAGSTALNGVSTWSLGDWVIYNGTAWEKVDNTDAVVSVNGFTGAVSLTTASVTESGNLYFTDARARAALSFTAGSGAYNSTTGVITIPTNTNQLTNGAGFITGNQSITVSGDAGGSGTTAITLTLATVNANIGTFNNVTVNAKGLVTAASNVSYLTGNQNITVSGDVSGSGTTTINTTLATITQSTGANFVKITLDTKGRVTGNTAVGSGDITTALGYTPYNSSNPSGYTSNTGTVTSVSGTGTVSGLTLTGTVTTSGSLTLGGTLSLTSGNVTTALGYTPYNATNPNGYISSYTEVDTLATVTARGNVASGSIQASNFYDGAGSFNVNLGSAGNEGRGVVAGYSGSAYSGIGYNVRHTTTAAQYIAPGTDTSSYIVFTGGGFAFYGAPSGVAGRTLSYTTLGSFSAAGTFNAVNLTVNGNQTLHHANWNSYAPSLTGTGASGNWGINITGSAASVTGLTITLAANGINPDNVIQNQIGYNTSVSLFGQTDGGLYSSAYSSAWIHQIFGDFRTGQIAIRGKNNGTWQAWRTVLDSGNYNSYAPTLTGTGASGTWGISITGNALTATSTTLLKSIGDYPWLQSTLPVSYSTGMQLAFVGPASGEGSWQNYGTVINARSYSSGGGGSLQMYVPYGPDNGGNALQVRFGNYSVDNGNSWTAWKTLLQSDNYNSYAPTLTGTGASGTWGINITGSANSANSATNALRIVFEDGPRNLSDRLPTTLARSVNFDFVGAGIVGGAGNYAGVMSFTPWTGTTTSTGDSSYQLAFMNETSINGAGLPGLRLRKGIDITWGDWYTLLHAGNYNSYAPSLTGVGASGTWGISISGSAAQLGGISSDRAMLKRRTRIHSTDSTSLDSSITAPEMGFTYGGSGEPTGPYMAFGGLNGNIDYSCQLVGAYNNGGNNFVIRTNNGDVPVWNPWRTLITDGNYNSYSPTLTGTGASGTWGISISGNAATVTGGVYTSGDQNITGAKLFYSPTNSYINTTSNANQGLTVYQSTDVADAFMTFHIGANYAAFFGLGGAEDDLVWGGWSAGNVRHRILHSGNYNLYAPTLTGGGASGTWGINVTGTAGSETLATVTARGASTPTNININNTSPTIYLQDIDHRSAMIHVNSNVFYVLRGNGNNSTTWEPLNGYWPMELNLDTNNATFGASVTAAGDVTAYSDVRLKENIVTVENALEKVTGLRGVTYNRKDNNDGKLHLGVIAQEVEQILPEVVKEDEKGMKHVAYGNMTAVLIEAIKEQQKQIEDLKKQIQYLVENK